MNRLAHLSTAVALLAIGFAGGVWIAMPSATIKAQQTPEEPTAEPIQISDANAEKVKQASDVLETAQAALQQDGLYNAAIRGLNPYATLSGGLDAVADLEDGRGVDPITFAGLHAGLATDEVTTQLSYDANGRLTYKGKLVRIYSVNRLRESNRRQAAVIDVTKGGRRKIGAPRE
ncbi:MAG: hypothetical protein M3552_16970 [Planctomycetota bacterium]|nr:hypothetical protein [Planctomycetaceae bacterium]MDQ3332314.1 hypothetical protein [Planctomycetota bacterium]